MGRALQELGIQLIFAQSPQVKGRIERLWGTLQDRLVSELRLAQVHSLADANQVLARYLKRFNRQFAVPAGEPQAAYEPVPGGLKLDRIFCFKYERLVRADNTVRFAGRELQLLPLPERRSWVRARVEVHEHFDGAIAVYYRSTHIPCRAAPVTAIRIRAREGPRLGAGPPQPPAPSTPARGALQPKPAWKPPRTHPWHMTYQNRFPSTGTKSEHA
ncbi:MAG: transposase [Chloroflexi bacterium]|nr:MAG: transposase [Chloroflexota bacterium]